MSGTDPKGEPMLKNRTASTVVALIVALVALLATVPAQAANGLRSVTPAANGLRAIAPEANGLRSVAPEANGLRAAVPMACCGAPYYVTNDPSSSRTARVAPHPDYYRPNPTPVFTINAGRRLTNPAIPEARIRQIYLCAGCIIGIWEMDSSGRKVGAQLQRIDGQNGWRYFNGATTYHKAIWVKYYN